MSDYFSGFFGELSSIIAIDHTLYLGSSHPEQIHTGLLAVNLDDNNYVLLDIPFNVKKMLVNANTIYALTADNKIVAFEMDTGNYHILEFRSGHPVKDMTLLGDRQIALVADTTLHIMDLSGQMREIIDLLIPASSIAAFHNGKWLAVGHKDGHISVLQCEKQASLQLSDRQKVHQGAVTSIVFEPAELRFFSAGTDGKLYLVHARGKLDIEDKGRSFNHEGRITKLLLGPQQRLFSAAKDNAIKSWPLDSNLQPGTFKDSGVIIDMCLVQMNAQVHLAAAYQYNMVRIFSLDESEKVKEKVLSYSDAYDWAKQILSQKDVDDQEEQIRRLGVYDDGKSNRILAQTIEDNRNIDISKMAAQQLVQSKNPKTPRLIEKLIQHKSEVIRAIIFDGLLGFYGNEDFDLLQNAIKTGYGNIALKAIALLAKAAKKHKQAIAYLADSLDAQPQESRQAALQSLADLATKTALPNILLGLKSRFADVRRQALLLLLQKGLLSETQAQAALRQSLSDDDIQVRRDAFFLSIIGNHVLSDKLRTHSDIYQRAFSDIEALCKKTKSGKQGTEYSEPLLLAMASKYTDVSLLGAHALAILGDQRAFGLLLQLSRDTQPQTRAQVCFAFAAMQDQRATHRLKTLMNDDVLEVRDAAYSAIERILPQQAVAIGMLSHFEDIRARALNGLIAQYKNASHAWFELEQTFAIAINDAEFTVRQEAAKTLLNQYLDDDRQQTFDFLNRSGQADIRMLVINEVIANIKQAWAMPRLYDAYADHGREVRFRAFEFLIEHTDKKSYDVYERALQSPHADLRMSAVEKLIQLNTEQAQVSLTIAIHDKKENIRQTVLQSIISHGSQAALEKILQSDYDDIRVQAGCALARLGNGSAGATLLALLQKDTPQEEQQKQKHYQLMVQALNGLAELGDFTVFNEISGFLQHRQEMVVEAAARALFYLSRVDDCRELQEYAKHKNKTVKQFMAAALAIHGQQQGSSLLFAEKSRARAELKLCVAIISQPQQLFSMLDYDDAVIRDSALRMVLFAEWFKAAAYPDLLLQALSAQFPRIRLLAAQALQHYQTSAQLLTFIIGNCNRRQSKNPWDIPAGDIASAIKLASTTDNSFIKLKFCELLLTLSEEKQQSWDLHWKNFSIRFAGELSACRQRADPDVQMPVAELLPLIFGAYIGLMREQDSDGDNKTEVRLQALTRLIKLSDNDAQYQDSVYPVLFHALNDAAGTVRSLAFEQLINSELPAQVIYREALACKYSDIGKQALHWFNAQQTSPEQLLQVISEQESEIAIEAIDLALQNLAETDVIETALNADQAATRRFAVQFLEQHFEAKPFARDLIIQSLESRYAQTKLEAALILARKKDHTAADTLGRLLVSAEFNTQQNNIVKALLQIGSPQAAEVMLDFLENDEQQLAKADLLLDAVGSLRMQSLCPRLFALAQNKEYTKYALQALLKISGHDQVIVDTEDNYADTSWLEKQYPRDDQVLADILEWLLERDDIRPIRNMLAAIRWSQSSAVDAMLANLIYYSDESFAQSIVEIIGWRVKNRNASHEPLLAALNIVHLHFKAAVMLARAKFKDGLSILLSTVENGTEFEQRNEAILALGELADTRALDMLLKYARESEHGLQGAAIEALGHLGTSDKAEEIFQLLCERANVKDWYGRGLAENAIDGLRWFNTPDAWQYIRQVALTNDNVEEKALETLGYNDTPETREFLLDFIMHNDSSEYDAAFESAKKLFRDSLEPDYALLQREHKYGYQTSLDRVCEKGDTQRILTMLPACDADIQQALTLALIARENLAADGIVAALQSADARTVESAAQIAGRQPAQAQLLKAVEQALNAYWQQYTQLKPQIMLDRGLRRKFNMTAAVLQKLMWAAGQLATGLDSIIDICKTLVTDSQARDLLLAALKATLDFNTTEALTDLYNDLIEHPHTAVREIVLSGILQSTPDVALHERIYQYTPTLHYLRKNLSGDRLQQLQTMVATEHYQGVLLPALIEQQDIQTLSTLALNADSKDAARFGAVEGLARMPSSAAQAKLIEIARACSDMKELAKAAWRGARRCQRLREKMESLSHE